jgi:predicted RNA-binding Zn-ribbon protein involved in translation (DUF1610 family)
MPRSTVKGQRIVRCPSCQATLRLQPGTSPLAICPRCGEWVVGIGRKRVERWRDEAEASSAEETGWESLAS